MIEERQGKKEKERRGTVQREGWNEINKDSDKTMRERQVEKDTEFTHTRVCETHTVIEESYDE